MSAFTTRPCVICRALVRWEELVCSDQCEVELDRRREGEPVGSTTGAEDR